VKRGEIRLVASGVYASKPRPAIILQDHLFDATDSVTVCPLTTTIVDAPLMRVPLPANEQSGIQQPSFVMVDKVTTVRRSNVGDQIGALTAAQMLEVERLVLVFLGIGR
jgi:mRNA interferase MazF